MKRRAPVVTVLAAFVVLLGMALAPPALAAVPPASVQLTAPGQVGRFDTAIVPMQVRCRVGLQSRALVVTVTQQNTAYGTVTGSRTISSPVACNGTWHTMSVELGSTSGAPFEAGQAKVTARLTVRNPATGGTPQAGTDTRFVKLLAPAKVELGTAPIRHGSGGIARVPVRFRCQVPWVPVQLSVEVSQNDGALGGQTFLVEGDSRLVCDAEWHQLVIYVPASNGKFFTGPARVDLLFDVQDPIDFDPVDQASFTAMTQIVDDD